MSATPTEAFDNALKARWGYASGDPLPWSNMTPKAVYDVAREVLTAPPAAASAGSGEGPAELPGEVIEDVVRPRCQRAFDAIGFSSEEAAAFEMNACHLMELYEFGLGPDDAPIDGARAVVAFCLNQYDKVLAALAGERSRADAAEATLRDVADVLEIPEGGEVRHTLAQFVVKATGWRSALQQAEARAADMKQGMQSIRDYLNDQHPDSRAHGLGVDIPHILEQHLGPDPANPPVYFSESEAPAGEKGESNG